MSICALRSQYAGTVHGLSCRIHLPVPFPFFIVVDGMSFIVFLLHSHRSFVVTAIRIVSAIDIAISVMGVVQIGWFAAVVANRVLAHHTSFIGTVRVAVHSIFRTGRLAASAVRIGAAASSAFVGLFR